MPDVLTGDYPQEKSYVKCDLRERNSLVAWEWSDVYSVSAYLRQRTAVLWTHRQNAYASIVRIIRAEDEKKGIDFLTEVFLCWGKQKERKAVSEVACSRSAHSYARYTKFGKCLHVSMRVYLSFLFVSCPVSCLVHDTFLFECTRSNRPVAERW